MGGGALVAAEMAARKRRIQAVLDAFRLAGATSPERARTREQLGLGDSIELDQLYRTGVVLPGAEPDTWYLSEVAYVAHRGQVAGRRHIVVVVLIAIALFLVSLGYLIVMRRS